MTITQINQPV